jgi:hypothetical protein
VGNGKFGVLKPPSLFDARAEKEASASWCLASCACRDGLLPDVIFEVLRSKPSLVLSKDMEATEETEIP